jgi:hypothetical protein
MPARRASSPAIVFGIGALALLGVVVLFQVVLEPPERIACSSELAPGTFRETLVPAHLAVAAILIGCLYELGANRRGLAAVAVFALVSVVVPAGFALVGFAAMLAVQLLAYIALPALLICTVVVLRRLRDPAERREALVGNTRTALWLGLTVVLPANLAFAWLSGVSLFCF